MVTRYRLGSSIGESLVLYRGGPQPQQLEGFFDFFNPVSDFFQDAAKWIQQRLGVYKKPFFHTAFGAAVVGLAFPPAMFFTPYIQQRLDYYKKPFLQTVFGKVVVGTLIVGATAGLAISLAPSVAAFSVTLKSALGTLGSAIAAKIAGGPGQWFVSIGKSLFRVTKGSKGDAVVEDMGIVDEVADPIKGAIKKATDQAQALLQEKLKAEMTGALKGAIGIPDSRAIVNATPLPDLGLLPPPTPVPLGLVFPDLPGGTAPLVFNTGTPGQTAKLPDTISASLVGGRYEVQTAAVNPLLALGLAGAAYAMYKGRVLR